MKEELEALEKIDHTVCLAFNENNNALFNKDKYEHIDCKDIYEFVECYDIIEKALKEYQEIKKIAKCYNWECLAFDISSTETDEKWRKLFCAAIIDVQEDYRKARAVEIITKSNVDVVALRISINLKQYNCKEDGRCPLTQEEYDLLKEVLL